ncbi:MAG: DNA repair protein RecN [Candidatus Cloacimonetes bacterium]|nr:DNA repair protein RecN [Candidatus Cloacimonadota bacterium]
MLKSLKIKNFIIAKDITIDFCEGLQVLTGETGAGKSIVIGALNIILGGQVKSGMLFDENKPAVLEAVFSIENNEELNLLIQKFEVDITENELFFCKEIIPGYKVKCYMNGLRITNNIVKEFGEVLLDFHSQRDQQLLLSPVFQREILDKAGNIEEQLTNYKVTFTKLENISSELDAMQKKEKENRERIQLFEFQSGEISSMDLAEGEDERLANELNLLSNAEEIIKNVSEFEHIVYESDRSFYDVLNNYAHIFSNFENDNDFIKAAAENIYESLAHLDEAVNRLRNVRDMIDLDKEKMLDVQSRLDEINSLKNKYRMNLSEIIAYGKQLNSLIVDIKSEKDKISAWEKEKNMLGKKLVMQALHISDLRKKAALKLSDLLEKNIQKLAMEGARFGIDVSKITSGTFFLDESYLSINGSDKVEFIFSANPGKELQAVKQAASGGELSRLLLAIKKVISENLSQRTIVFDEIDSGIGGRTADLIGEYISDIADNHQVICITHLPQIASFADKHFQISKRNADNYTELEVHNLDIESRSVEIARMLSGSTSNTALQHAEELLKKNNQNKR